MATDRRQESAGSDWRPARAGDTLAAAHIADVQARRGVPSPRGVAIEKHATRQQWRLGEENQRLGYIP